LRAATAATGGAFDFTRFNSKQEAINDLTARMQAMLGSARAAQGDPALRGSIDVMLRELDVAKNSSPSFHRMVEAIGRQQQALIDEGVASNEFLKAPTPASAEALRNRIMENRIRAAEELRRSGFSGADTSAGGGGGGGGGQVHVYSSQDEVNADIAAGELHEWDKVRIGRGPKAITGTVGHVQ
jgi:hypothetical protein